MQTKEERLTEYLRSFKTNSKEQKQIERSMQLLRKDFSTSSGELVDRAKEQYDDLAARWELLEKDNARIERLMAMLPDLERTIVKLHYIDRATGDDVQIEVNYSRAQPTRCRNKAIKKLSRKLK